MSWFPISAGPNNRSQPAIAYNRIRDEYLIVWQRTTSTTEIVRGIWRNDDTRIPLAPTTPTNANVSQYFQNRHSAGANTHTQATC